MEKNLLKNLYQTMVKIRLCEESLVRPILKGEIKTPCHLYTGQEAIATGVCANLNKEDYVFSTHRGHGHYLAKGGNLNKLIAEIFTKETGCSRGRGGSMHINAKEVGFLGSSPIVAGTISLAVGTALSSKIRGEKKAVVSFFGDGATGEGVLYESLNFAALKKLPIIFVCENNLYSTHLPIRECRPPHPIYKIAEPFGIKTFQADGNDVIEVYKKVKESVSFCRKGKGPVFIEFLTYRLRGHVGPDDNIQGEHAEIRPIMEVKEWKKKEPIKRFENYLLKKKILTEEEIKTIKREMEKEIKNAYKFAKESPNPKTDDLNKYVFK